SDLRTLAGFRNKFLRLVGEVLRRLTGFILQFKCEPRGAAQPGYGRRAYRNGSCLRDTQPGSLVQVLDDLLGCSFPVMPWMKLNKNRSGIGRHGARQDAVSVDYG